MVPHRDVSNVETMNRAGITIYCISKHYNIFIGLTETFNIFSERFHFHEPPVRQTKLHCVFRFFITIPSSVGLKCMAEGRPCQFPFIQADFL